jgi:hypothetical protein
MRFEKATLWDAAGLLKIAIEIDELRCFTMCGL